MDRLDADEMHRRRILFLPLLLPLLVWACTYFARDTDLGPRVWILVTLMVACGVMVGFWHRPTTVIDYSGGRRTIATVAAAGIGLSVWRIAPFGWTGVLATLALLGMSAYGTTSSLRWHRHVLRE